MQVGTERRGCIFHASQLGKGLVKELDGPSLWFVLGPQEGSNFGPQEGSNCHEGHEACDEVRDTTGTLGISGIRLKGAVKRVEQEGLDVVQGCHSEFSHLLPQRNSGQHVEEELVQQSLAGPFLGEEWLRAVIFLFDAVLRLVFLEMEQVSCEHMPCIRVYSKVYSMQALTEQQDESGLSGLNHLT